MEDARSLAREALAAIRRSEASECGEALFEEVANSVFERHSGAWKARTLEVNQGYLKSQLMPHFAGRPVPQIDRPEFVA